MNIAILKKLAERIKAVGEAVFFLGDIFKVILSGRVRFSQVLDQMYFQGVQSVLIVVLSSLASGIVLGLQGSITLERFGAGEFIAPLVALSLLRELFLFHSFQSSALRASHWLFRDRGWTRIWQGQS